MDSFNPTTKTQAALTSALQAATTAGNPQITRSRESSGNRCTSLASSTTSASGRSSTVGMLTIPIPRISSLPRMVAGALAVFVRRQLRLAAPLIDLG